jgi:hypothetical protein
MENFTDMKASGKRENCMAMEKVYGLTKKESKSGTISESTKRG